MSESARSRLIARLSPRAIRRVSVDAGGGVGLAIAAVPLAALGWHGSLRWPVLLLVIPAALGAALAGALAYLALGWAAGALRAPRAVLRRSRGLLTGALIAVAVLVISLLTPGGPGRLGALAGRAVAAVLPAVLVAVAGGWAVALCWRRLRGARTAWRRRVPDGLAMLVTGLTCFFLVRRDVLATEPAAGLLFPVAAGASFRAWRAMGRSAALAVRAGADIAFSLLLGADLVLFLVWLANLLDLPAGEVAVLRAGLERAGGVVDVPWWLWAGLYALLAGASLAVALRPEALAAVRTWGTRLRVVPSVDVTQRVLSGVHIGLAVTVLLALTAPPAVGATLSRQVQAQYTLAVDRAVTADADRAAYAEITRQFAAGAPGPVSPLAALVDRLHEISPPPPGQDEATPTERDDARRLGRLQATALRVTPPPAAAAEAAADEAAGTAETPAGGGAAARADARLGRVDAQRRRAAGVTKLADQAGELAASAVAATIQIPGLGDNEVVGILTEYLSGLVESGPLKETFAAWARRLAGRTAPPPADELVVPDPAALEEAALISLVEERRRVPLADPLEALADDQRTLRESPADAAADLANQARFLAEGGGPCAGCARPLRPGEEPGEGPGDHPEEPPEHAP